MQPPHLALVYETFGAYPRRVGDPDDFDAEYEPEETVRVLEAATRRLGYHPLRLGSPHQLLARIGKGELPELAAALTIAEGYGSRNREGWAPALLEMAGVPTLGSDGLCLALCLDKQWATRAARAAGVPAPAQVSLRTADEAAAAELPAPFPLFVKPRWEGTAKGVRRSSRVATRAALAAEVERVARDYDQPALVEEFLPGAEYTVTLVGNEPPRALPVLQRALDAATGIGLHALERRGGEGAPAGSHHLPGSLEPGFEKQLQALAVRATQALECRDFARVDFKLDAAGRPRFLELNPLPTFAPDGSFGILAELEGRELADLLAEVLAGGLRRLGLPAPATLPAP
jgi:D-alanine-D-alanine ligase